MFFIFDTETTGFPSRKGYNASFGLPPNALGLRPTGYWDPSLTNYYNSSRIIQIAYIVADKDKKEIFRKVFYVKPDNFKIENSHIHGITDAIALEKGKNINEVLKELYTDLSKCKVLVAHNLDFDFNVLMSECYRYFHINLIEELLSKAKFCTLEQGKRAFFLEKSPKLVELYKLCYKEETWVQKHDAMDDTEKCFACFQAIHKG